jgi:hypothetical protein
MPGIIGGLTGFVDRSIGKGVVSSAWLNKFGKGGAAAAGGGNIFAFVSQAGVGNGADVTEDTLSTMTLPAGCLDINGREVLIQAFGSITATSATKAAKVYWGSTLLTTFSATTTQTGAWCLSASIFRTASGQQVTCLQTDTTITGSLVRSITVGTAAEADTAGIIIKVTGTSSAATAGLILCNGLIVGGYN